MIKTAVVLLWFELAPSSDELLVRQIADSGRCATVAESADGRVGPKPMIAPGQPPLLSFRYFEGKMHHRFNNSDLMLDDAGH